MLNVKEAVTAAQEFARTMFPESDLKQMRIEEIDSANSGKQWLITLGWPETAVRHVTSAFGIQNPGVFASPRVYKQFTVDSETGAVLSMKVRDL